MTGKSLAAIVFLALGLVGGYLGFYETAERALAKCQLAAIEKLSAQRHANRQGEPTMAELDHARACMNAKGFVIDAEARKADGVEGALLSPEYRHLWEGNAKYWRRKFT